MSDNTHIEWTDATWNPITGCSVVSAGCKHCYAMKLAGTRLQHHPSRAGLTQETKAGPVWTGEVRFNEEWIAQPLRWRRPRRIFVCAHGDLFHAGVPDEWIDRVFAVMALAPQHTFQVLTKRPERMRDYLRRELLAEAWWEAADRFACNINLPEGPGEPYLNAGKGKTPIPLPNVWLGVSVEDQATADERIPLLLQCPAAVRWISAEPLLGPVDLSGYLDDFRDAAECKTRGDWASHGLQWVVAGGESGTGARPMHPDWARSLRDQCAAARVPFLFKQWGAWWPTSQDLTRSDEHYAKSNTTGGWIRKDGSSHRGESLDAFRGGDAHVLRISKKAAGRQLDGVQHDGYPEAA